MYEIRKYAVGGGVGGGLNAKFFFLLLKKRINEVQRCDLLC